MRASLHLVLAIIGAAPLLAACESAPVTGRSQMMLVSEAEERRMGETAYLQVMAKERPSHNADALALVEKVGRRIANAAEAPPTKLWNPPHYHWEFRTVDKNVLNAFCLPGGKIAVYTGLLAITENEAGLAAVIGHEVAHALARHSAERLSEQKMVSVGVAVAAAVVVAALGGGQRSSTASNVYAPMAVAALGAGAAVGIMLPMSRKQESEADHIGLVLMAMAGYDPNEAVALWERMRAASAGKPKQAEWLSTHPATDTRIADLKSWVPEAMKYYRPRE